MRRLVVLRPEPGASQTIARANRLGMLAVAVPLFDLAPLPWQAPDPTRFDGLLLTSANAVRHGGDELAKLRTLPVYAVGDSTAEAARQAGFDIAAVGNAGVDRLLASVEPDLELLHLCGEDRREPADPRQRIARIAAYRAKPIDDPDLRPLSRAVALVHSPRAAERLAALMRERASTTIAAISQAAAEAAGGGWRSVEAAEAPNDEALLALAARLCNIPPLQ
jgi:uroporphyrinogen-III synthase